jgi:hypothetical protein
MPRLNHNKTKIGLLYSTHVWTYKSEAEIQVLEAPEIKFLQTLLVTARGDH